MFENFLVTGFGHCGTMWLTSLININSKSWTVKHEPNGKKDMELSNTDSIQKRFNQQYYGEVNSYLRLKYYHLNVKYKAVIIRPTKDIIMSCFRAGKTETQLCNIVDDLYCVHLFLAQIPNKINFKKMTTDTKYLQTVLHTLGVSDVTVTEKMLLPINCKTQVKLTAFTYLPESIQRYYENYYWLF